VAEAKVKAVDVAAAAGVSTATVSLVVNGKTDGRVADATVARVREVIAELGYTVNASASALVTGRHHCIGLVASDVTNPFISTVAAGVADALGDDHQLVLAVTGADRPGPDLDRILAFGVDGLLLDLPLADEVHARDPSCPVVVLDDAPSRSVASTVSFDVGDAARALATHLVDLGHQRIAYLDAVRPLATFRSRRQALTSRLRRLNGGGLLLTARAPIDLEAARIAVRDSWPLWSSKGITALVTAADLQAYGALAAFDDLGVNVPSAVSLASFDGLPYATITNPALTTVTLPAFELGREGAHLLAELIAGNTAAPSIELPARLDIRASTAPAPAGGRTNHRARR
jgi:LacI family transcriptional regulator